MYIHQVRLILDDGVQHDCLDQPIGFTLKTLGNFFPRWKKLNIEVILKLDPRIAERDMLFELLQYFDDEPGVIESSNLGFLLR